MPQKLSDKQKAVIEVLNKARSMELYAIYQYMNQHYGLDDDNYGKLASAMKKIAIEEMKHAEAFAERIKDICGDQEPTADAEGKLVKGQEVEDIYKFDAKVEDDTLKKYNEFILVCRQNGDAVSATLFEKIIADEQAHFNYFDDTATHIEKLGGSFLARMTEGASD